MPTGIVPDRDGIGDKSFSPFEVFVIIDTLSLGNYCIDGSFISRRRIWLLIFSFDSLGGIVCGCCVRLKDCSIGAICSVAAKLNLSAFDCTDITIFRVIAVQDTLLFQHIVNEFS